ncbi:MAG: MFS transporter [Holosporaceae bacterium]|jgi:MFS family permease|nr:MFS transporter [Holosporaceae bacterium]
MNSKNNEQLPPSEDRGSFVFGLPKLVWIVGIVSFFSNSASVIITAFSAEFIINILGASPSDLGYIRGLSEALSYLVKMASGVFSDWLGRRKILMLIGYLCAALAKPMFAFCQGLKLYVTAQILERITNGLRDTPRDALIADCTPKELKGASYGVRQSCAFMGSMVGAIIGFLILRYFGGAEIVIRRIYLFATLPIFVAVLLIHFGIKEPANIVRLKDRKGFPIKKADVSQLGKDFWYYMLICFVFMCSRYSESFLVYRAQHLGLQVQYAPLVLALMYLFNSPTSRIVGNWSDKHERKLFLAFGFCMMLVSCVILAFATEIWQVLIGVAVYGIHYGATQGTFYAMVSDYSPPHIKGTSIGIFNLVCCVGMCFSNAITGELWKRCGAETTFLVNSAITFVATVGVMFIHNRRKEM